MKIFPFFCKQIILGSVIGALDFSAFALWKLRTFSINAAFEVWFAAFVLTSLFLVLIAAPLQMACRLWAAPMALGVGLLSGPIAILVVLLNWSRAPITIENLFAPYWLYHVIFALIGLFFSVSFQLWLKENGQPISRAGV